MPTLEELQESLAVCQDDLEQCREDLAADPTETSIEDIIKELKEQIVHIQSQIAAAGAHHPSPPASDDVPPPPPPTAINATAIPPPPPAEPAQAQHLTFNVGDTILARYSKDKHYYEAKVISKTGSGADPVYYVHFLGYPDKENKRNHEVKAIESKKRKADGSTAAAAPPNHHAKSTPVQNGAVISAAPSLHNVSAKHVPSKVSDGPTRMAPEPKRLKGNKKLEKSANSWQSFQKTGPKNPVAGISKSQLGKDSMFRTANLPNAKVGFTGSGRPMQKEGKPTSWKPAKKDLRQLDAD